MEDEPRGCPTPGACSALGTIAELRTELAGLKATMDRGGIDISPCGGCGLPTACLPEGFAPLCEACALKEEPDA